MAQCSPTKILPLLALCLFWAGTGLDPANASGSMYLEKDRGYFFYEPEPEPEPEPEEPEPPPPPVAEKPKEEPEPEPEPAPPPPPPPTAESAEPEGPAPLSSAWLKENLQSYLFKALDNPTHDNIKAYMYLQRLMVDRSEKMARETQVVLALNPDLSADSVRPRFGLASTALNQQAIAKRQSILTELGQGMHYTLVVRADCELCALQYRTLDIHARRHGGSVEIVSVDGNGLPSEGIAPMPVDTKRIRALQPKAAPSVYAAYQGGPDVLLTRSPMSVDSLQKLLIQLAAGNGWIDRKAYQETITTKQEYLSLPRDEEGNPSMPEEILDNPGLLSEFLRARMEESYE